MPYLSASMVRLSQKEVLYQVSSTFTFTFYIASESIKRMSAMWLFPVVYIHLLNGGIYSFVSVDAGRSRGQRRKFLEGRRVTIYIWQYTLSLVRG